MLHERLGRCDRPMEGMRSHFSQTHVCLSCIPGQARSIQPQAHSLRLLCLVPRLLARVTVAEGAHAQASPPWHELAMNAYMAVSIAALRAGQGDSIMRAARPAPASPAGRPPGWRPCARPWAPADQRWPQTARRTARPPRPPSPQTPSCGRRPGAPPRTPRPPAVRPAWRPHTRWAGRPMPQCGDALEPQCAALPVKCACGLS